MSAKHDAVSIGYVPGPDGYVRAKGNASTPSRTPGADPGSRLRSSMAGAAPSQQFTPDQVYFRSSLAQGRWQSNFNQPAQPANLMRQDPDTGCVDVSSLEPCYNPNGADQWIDLGGKGGVDVAAGRP